MYPRGRCGITRFGGSNWRKSRGPRRRTRRHPKRLHILRHGKCRGCDCWRRDLAVGQSNESFGRCESLVIDQSGCCRSCTRHAVDWLGKPVFIRRRTDDEIKDARAVDLSELIDTSARNNNAPTLDAADKNRALDDSGEWLVMMGVCTHLGCVPLGDGAGDFHGWFCPCHGSHYDTSGRIRKGPAPENLPVPVAAFVDDATIKLG